MPVVKTAPLRVLTVSRCIEYTSILRRTSVQVVCAHVLLEERPPNEPGRRWAAIICTLSFYNQYNKLKRGASDNRESASGSGAGAVVSYLSTHFEDYTFRLSSKVSSFERPEHGIFYFM